MLRLPVYYRVPRAPRVAPVAFGAAARKTQAAYLEALRALSPEAQQAMREIFELATREEGHLGAHAYFASVLAGKYPEIRPFVLDEALGIMVIMRAPEATAQRAREARKTFQSAAALFCREAVTPAPDYVPVKTIPKTQARAYLDEYLAFERPFLEAIERQYPSVRRRI